MTKKERLKDSISSLETQDTETATALFIKSSTDNGVRRNLGRSGARYAPDALISVFKKMSNYSLDGLSFFCAEVSSRALEDTDFSAAQIDESLKIQKLLKTNKQRSIHIGGGHDHVYPLLLAMEAKSKNKPIFIINIDAHLDTRVDDKSHSGTPFRDFDQVCKGDVTLLQYGIHNYSNGKSTFSKLKNIKQKVLAVNDSSFSGEIKKIPKDSLLLISLDADAIDSSQMQAVSAVNHNGVKLEEIRTVISSLKNHKESVFGIYEYNPILDDLSQKGARNLSSLIYEYIKE